MLLINYHQIHGKDV